MIKVKVEANYGFAGTDMTFEEEFDDDVTDEEIEEVIGDMVMEQVDWSWGERAIMSREILFKAKRIDNGEWVEGCIVMDQSRLDIFKYRIQPIESGVLYAPPIDPDTLCQYTGLTDKNGKKIWENDILRYSYDYDGSPFLKDGEEIKYRAGAVFWSEWRGSWAVCGRGNKKCTNNDVFKYNRNPNRTEVIGNIFDNPELLEVE